MADIITIENNIKKYQKMESIRKISFMTLYRITIFQQLQLHEQEMQVKQQ